ncbi:MAG: dehydratase [Elusimicrobiota bacterium]|jgi:acyl dehydratase|nr:dehydratase [Elusimicrobiota bacterium]
MNTYSYEDIYIGMSEGFTAVLDNEYIDCFRKFTKDINPLHKDDCFAKSKGYERKVVFGMLIASFYSTLAGVYIPGQNSLIHSITVKFVKPVYAPPTTYCENLFVNGVVSEKDDRFKLLTIKATIKNQNKETVSRAVIKAAVI